MGEGRLYLLTVALLALGACRPTAPMAVGEEDGMDDAFTIQSGTQLDHDGNLGIAAGNFWGGDFVGPGGEVQHGLTAGLWLTLRDGREENRHVRVHPGQVLNYGGYAIEVLEVAGGDLGPFVRIVIGGKVEAEP
jgi:hypothetical protein